MPANRGTPVHPDERREARPAAPAPASGWARAPLFEVEDAALAAWLAGAGWILARVSGEPLGWAGDGTAGAWALLALAAFLLGTRGPDDTDLDTAIKRRALLVGPAYPLLPLYGLAGRWINDAWRRRAGGVRARGAAADPTVDPADAWPGPYVTRFWRRTAALPIALVADAMFNEESRRRLPAPGELADAGAVLHLLMVVAAFVFLVVGPRLAAGATMRPWPWVARFALAVVAAWAGAALPTAN